MSCVIAVLLALTLANTLISKITWREWFAKLVNHFEKWTADHLVVYNIDRIARNPLDEWNIKWLAQQWKIKQIHSPQGIFDGRQILVLSLHMAMANQYTIDLSARICDWKLKKVKSWKISRRAPLWYSNNKETKDIETKENEVIYIKRIFEMRAEKFSLNLITDQINNEWFVTRKWNKVWKTVIERILKNPFYYGMIYYNHELYKWTHEPIVSKKLWDKANDNWRGIVIIKDRYLSPLKWKVTHYESWKKMSVSLIKKKYIYFHLHHRKNNDKKIWFLQKNMIKTFEKNIDFYCIPKEKEEIVKNTISKNTNPRFVKKTNRPLAKTPKVIIQVLIITLKSYEIKKLLNIEM